MARNINRDYEIYEKYKLYGQYARVAREFNLTSSRVQQIIHAFERRTRAKLSNSDDLLFQICDEGKISVATYNSLRRAGYGTKIDISLLIAKLQSDELKPSEIRNLGKAGISSLKKALLNDKT